MNKLRRTLAMLLTLATLLTAVPAAALAAETAETEPAAQEVTAAEETEAEVPAEEEIAPAEEEAASTEEEAAPTEEETAPAEEETAAPTEEETAPAEEEAAPAEEEEVAPTAGETAEETATETFLYINPLYADRYDGEESISTASDGETIYVDAGTYGSLSDAGTALRSKMKSRTESFSITYTKSSSYSDNDFYSILDSALAHTGKSTEGDYLRFQFGSIGGNISQSGSGSSYRITMYLTVDYYTTASQENQVTTAVKNLRTSLGLSGKTQYDKVKAIYSWICSNVTYDYDYYYNGDVPFTAYGAIIEQSCVCQGYALLFYRLALEEGIDARIISGYGDYVDESTRHAWNIVKLDNKYYNLDATWDAGTTSWSYFLRCPANFDGDHIRHYGETESDLDYTASSFTSKYPMGSSDYTGLATPTLTKVENTAKGVKISWKAVSGATSYTLYYKTAGSGWKQLNTTTGTSYVNSGAASGTTYAYTVRARSTSAVSGYDNTGLSILCLRTPTLTKAENAANGVKVSWQSVTGASGYTVYYKTGSSGWTRLGSTSGTSYTHSAAVSGTTYTYTVRATKGSTMSGYNSTGLSVCYLSTPTLTKAENATKGVVLSWNAVSGATGYTLYYKTGSSGWKKLNTTTGTSYTNSGAASGTTYTYTVRATKGSSISGYDSAGLTILRLSTPTLSKMTNLHAGISLSWAQTKGAGSYSIYRQAENGSYAKIATVEGSTSYTDTAVQAMGGSTYTYWVVAEQGIYQSDYQVSDSIVRLDTPAIKSLTQTDSGVVVQWNTISGCSGYNIYRKTGSGSYVKIDYVRGSTSSSYTDTSVSGKTGTYTYKVEAYRGSSRSGYTTRSITVS